ncbi:hypothetical protein [Kordiimonas marina]|uniref:hypothetical protein n=1 Tax=Kordiimonas marina TaxID=2872312 RepID=UPI001FF2606E|nr:hypothetical protein [Kordiimonas marina]MCJ9427943.1 hypothetical protein [Kordiimonas marina]
MGRTLALRANWRTALMLSLVMGLSGMALSSPASAEVQVEFVGYLARYMGDISRIDARREKSFRQYRSERSAGDVPVITKRPPDRTDKTDWANERLFPNLADYNVPDLFMKMLERGLKAADPGFKGKLVVSIDKMKIGDFSVAVIRASRRTQMAATVSLYDANGKLVKRQRVVTSLHPKHWGLGPYAGPDYAYAPGAFNTRVGPLAAQFTEAVLETLYPKYDAPGPISVRPR